VCGKNNNKNNNKNKQNNKSNNREWHEWGDRKMAKFVCPNFESANQNLTFINKKNHISTSLIYTVRTSEHDF
jgi:hypothetical protein